MKRGLAIVSLIPFLLSMAPGSGETQGAPTARAFIESVWAEMPVTEIPCALVGRTVAEELPPGAIRCGRLRGDSIYSIVHGEAFGLAETGVPLLNLESWSTPPNQLVGFPALAALPEIPGFDVVGYLIETQRVGVWTKREAWPGDDLLVLTLEEVGPFPPIMPAETR
jgi:hypothetical protein